MTDIFSSNWVQSKSWIADDLRHPTAVRYLGLCPLLCFFALILKPFTWPYFWLQKSIPRPQDSRCRYFERENRTKTDEIMAFLSGNPLLLVLSNMGSPWVTSTLWRTASFCFKMSLKHCHTVTSLLFGRNSAALTFHKSCFFALKWDVFVVPTFSLLKTLL